MIFNVFLPCRKGSKRVPNKNIKPFGSFKFGLLELKLKELLKIKELKSIVLSSDDERILNYAQNLKDKRLVLHERKGFLASDRAGADDLAMLALELIKEGEILFTHVTSPFFMAKDYEKAICAYKKALSEDYDSLMSVTALHGFFWDKTKPINYERKFRKWPPTQNTRAIYEINSALFLANAEIYAKFKDRIGVKPYFYEIDKIKGLDIDYKEDFLMAESLLRMKIIAQEEQ